MDKGIEAKPPPKKDLSRKQRLVQRGIPALALTTVAALSGVNEATGGAVTSALQEVVSSQNQAGQTIDNNIYEGVVHSWVDEHEEEHEVKRRTGYDDTSNILSDKQYRELLKREGIDQTQIRYRFVRGQEYTGAKRLVGDQQHGVWAQEGYIKDGEWHPLDVYFAADLFLTTTNQFVIL